MVMADIRTIDAPRPERSFMPLSSASAFEPGVVRSVVARNRGGNVENVELAPLHVRIISVKLEPQQITDRYVV